MLAKIKENSIIILPESTEEKEFILDLKKMYKLSFDGYNISISKEKEDKNATHA